MAIIRIFDDIDESTLSKIVEALDDCKDGDDVTLQMCSAGGYVFYAFGIIDYLNSRRFRTTAEVLGMAASAAALIAISCNHVKIAAYGSIMLHGAYALGIGTDDPGIQRANSIQLEIIHKRNPEFKAEQLDRDTWFSARSALDNGFADEIINSAQDIAAICNAYIAHISKGVVVMDKDEKKVCAEDLQEEKQAEEIKAEDEITQDDVNEAILKRLEEIEHRLAVLEGEGKKADDELAPSDDPVMARRKALYAKMVNRVAAPQASIPVQPKASAPKASKIDLKSFLD